MSSERTFRQFDDLVVKAAELHPNAWCVRQQMVIITRDLKGQVCCPCKHYVVNGGICDPL